MTLEVNAAYMLDDERQTQLVFVKELLDRLQKVEKRCVELEATVHGSNWIPDAPKTQAATRARRAARSEEDVDDLVRDEIRLVEHSVSL